MLVGPAERPAPVRRDGVGIGLGGVTNTRRAAAGCHYPSRGIRLTMCRAV